MIIDWEVVEFINCESSRDLVGIARNSQLSFFHLRLETRQYETIKGIKVVSY